MMNFGAYALIILVVAIASALCFESVILPMLVRLGVVRNDFNDPNIVKYFEETAPISEPYVKLNEVVPEVMPLVPEVVPAAVVSAEPPTITQAIAVVTKHKYTGDIALKLLTPLRNTEGDWLLSANAIAAAAGGKREARMAEIARLRGGASPVDEVERAKAMIAKVSEESSERMLSIRAGKADERAIIR